MCGDRADEYASLQKIGLLTINLCKSSQPKITLYSSTETNDGGIVFEETTLEDSPIVINEAIVDVQTL